MNTIGIAVLIFTVAALGGAFLALLHFTGKKRPMPVVLLHGALAATGLVFLVIAYLHHDLVNWGIAALGLFVVAALGGFYLFSKEIQGKPLPSVVVLVHAGVAVTAFLMLASTLF